MTVRVLPLLLGLALVAALVLIPHLVPDTDARAAVTGPTGRALPVATTHPEAADGYLRRRAFTGEVRARRESALGFERAARVVALLVEEGDPVVPGQALARLDRSKLDAERARLVASRAEAEAVLAEMRAGPRASTIESAREAAADLRAQVELLERKAARRKQLLDSNTISDEEYDEVRSLLASLKARLRGAEDRLAELVDGTRAERIEAQGARVAQLEAALRRVDLDVRDSTLTAPFAGRILRRHLDEGSVATPGQPVLTLVEDGALEAWIGLPPRTALELADGDEHTVRIAGGAYDASLRARLPRLDAQTRTQTVLFALPAEAASHVVPGQVARLQLEERIDVQGFWLPTSALSRGVRGLWAVYGLRLAKDGEAYQVVRHPVEVLHTEAERTFVRGALDADVPVVTGNSERVAPGQRVLPAGGDA